jgi:hypothetical protein
VHGLPLDLIVAAFPPNLLVQSQERYQRDIRELSLQLPVVQLKSALVTHGLH